MNIKSKKKPKLSTLLQTLKLHDHYVILFIENAFLLYSSTYAILKNLNMNTILFILLIWQTKNLYTHTVPTIFLL